MHADDVKTALETVVPSYDGERGDWDAVVRRARGRRRSAWLAQAAVAAAAVAGVAALALAWPFGGERGGVLERALAAVGDGPVLHVVFEQEWGGTLVDLDTGERTPIHGEREVWYDPARGLKEISRFGGVVEHEHLYPPDQAARHETKTLALLRTGYEQALRSGRARVLGPGVVYGVSVHWIRVDEQWLPDVSDGELHEWAHDVAVSRDTFEPVATRETRDGRPGPDTGARIVRLEKLGEGAGDFSEPSRPRLDDVGFRAGASGPIDVAAALRVMPDGVWAGRELAGLRLAGIWRGEYATFSRDNRELIKETVGLTLFYGDLGERDTPGIVPWGRDRGPHVAIRQVPEPHLGFGRGVINYRPPEGSVLIIGPIGRMEWRGNPIWIEASSQELALAAARALRPLAG